MDVVAQIQAANAGRDPQRLQLKYRAMRESAFAFLRGSCALFYDRLPRGGIFDSAPLVWISGDLHLENFGSYRADNRLAYFDINDVDESALAPASWELVRFLASVLVGARGLGIKASRRRRLCRSFVDAYGDALAVGKAYWLERDTATGLIRDLLDEVRDRKRADFLDSRTVVRGKRRVLRVDGDKALAASAKERSMVRAFMHEFAATQPDPAFYRALDVARRIAGTGSLGVERYVILVRGKGSRDGNELLDLKAALPSALGARLKTVQPRWKSEAHRIVAVQQRLQAASIAFLHPVMMDGRYFVLRALQPAQDRIDLSRADAAELEALVRTMGQLVAWAQLRSAGRQGSAIADALIEFGQRDKWKAELLDATEASAAHVLEDAAAFDAAWDAGRFAGG